MRWSHVSLVSKMGGESGCRISQSSFMALAIPRRILSKQFLKAYNSARILQSPHEIPIPSKSINHIDSSLLIVKTINQDTWPSLYPNYLPVTSVDILLDPTWDPLRHRKADLVEFGLPSGHYMLISTPPWSNGLY